MLCRFPVAVAEVVQVEVAAVLRREQQLACPSARQLVERVERPGLEWYGSDARLGLGAAESALAEGAADVGNAAVTVNVAPLERDPLARTQTGGRGEDHHRPEARLESFGDGVEPGPGLERPLLGAPALRVLDALLGRVDVEHAPDDGAGEHLSPLRHHQPQPTTRTPQPLTHRIRPLIDQSSSPAVLSHRGAAVMHVHQQRVREAVERTTLPVAGPAEIGRDDLANDDRDDGRNEEPVRDRIVQQQRHDYQRV
jgi:hypothetical protein